MRSFGTSLAASALLHAVVFVVTLGAAREPVRPALVFPVTLVEQVGGGGGLAGPAAPPAAEAQVAETPRPAEVAKPPARRVAAQRPRPRAVRPVPELEPAPVGEGASGGPGVSEATSAAGTGGGGFGDESGGDGTGGARVAYGTNPLPPYPLMARRLGMEGVVLLEVLVEPNGRATEVRMLKSSGFSPLDESAATTVRERWRFIPARRGDTPIASRVTVPIRFRLADEAGRRG